MSDLEQIDRHKLAQRTIAMLSSMVNSGECHTSRSNEMVTNALKGLEELANEAKTSTKREGLIALVKGWKTYWMARVGARIEDYVDEYLSD